MDATLRRLRPWLLFGGVVLAFFLLAQMRELLVPIAVAVLFVFLLTPLVTLLQRRIGRIPAVLMVVIGCTAVLAVIVVLGLQELGTLADRLPDYRDNVRSKVSDIRGITEGGVIDKIDELVTDIQEEFDAEKARRAAAREVVIQKPASIATSNVSSILTPVFDLLVNAGIVFVLTTFMLLERQQLRDRIVRFFGQKQLATTTRAVDEAGRRMSRYLFAQLLVNAFYGAVVGVGLNFIGVPHALLWGSLATLLRFVPYIGPWLAAIPPILLSLAVAPGWVQPLIVVVLFIVLELFTNLVLETVFYAGVAGISQVGLLIAVLFWSWLWGPAGLLLAAPLTVCLVVVGKHVRGLGFLSELMTDETVTDAPGRYYQRLLAGDQLEAAEILQEHLRAGGAANVYDALMLPALTFAERDVAAGVLDPEEEAAVHQATAQLLDELSAADGPETEKAPSKDATLVLGFPVNQSGDTLALRMLFELLKDTSVQLEIGSASSLHSEIVQLIEARRNAVVCIIDLPPSAPSKTRYLVRRLRGALPHLRIVVGRWAPSSIGDESTAEILAAGADQVCSTLADTRQWLCQMRGLILPQ